MSDFHIDAMLGPERNPRQGVGAQDILRWQEGWRKHSAARREARRSERRREREFRDGFHGGSSGLRGENASTRTDITRDCRVQ